MDSDAARQINPFSNGKSQGLARQATYASVAVAALLIACKIGAWSVTGSVAILASLVDSLLDAFASIVTLVAVRKASAPATTEYRFGLGKAEPLAALTQAAFIAGSAVLLTVQAGERLFKPQPIQASEVGIAVMVVSIVATLGLVGFQAYVIRKSGSVAIKADSLHYKGDLLANAGVISALVLTDLLGFPQIDPLFGLAIAAYILWTARSVAAEALDMLLDKELPQEERDRIKEIALSYPEVLSMHDLRTRRAGPYRFIQIHLEFNGRLSLNHAHAVAEAVEMQVMEEFPGSEVIAHQDPTTPQWHEDTDPLPDHVPGRDT
ncbi:cation diffusion facilitator family transporter [Hwanghaeella sp.]|uniref:cation diffusion facilitator family transporter n=1 Tax=Hwanghaeella sp. TaxID=2605943 RepID=UPI003CCBC3F4